MNDAFFKSPCVPFGAVLIWVGLVSWGRDGGDRDISSIEGTVSIPQSISGIILFGLWSRRSVPGLLVGGMVSNFWISSGF